jgi:hypothetical protein
VRPKMKPFVFELVADYGWPMRGGNAYYAVVYPNIFTLLMGKN